ncbi:hypothetical protein [Coraliomargarita akajimensis]|uniref:PEP-CTERM protein-sorting domain-containing protein n=1 Tax=Coraliomargarita akajimensis (strain DSM 45221 / IAM 15411 / JCM 23193 / KCTC 12865 / 04OKA010-24) TaxID=583355 RepID=D5EQ79_CORAD|nr:hypothetical protein [Coraliomargarita akajimensis]ADE53847.1 hypothetical protein Caka_0823 [Coraliomargarita akajimensis DSM 45221]
MNKLPSLLLISAFSATVALQAQSITYVDAVAGSNTFATDTLNAPNTADWLLTNNSSTVYDVKRWDTRLFGTNGQIYQANPKELGSTYELRTEITGLADGTYDIWVFYASHHVQAWNIAAGLTTGSLTHYDDTIDPTGSGVTDASTLSYDGTSPTFNLTDGVDLLAVKIGRTTVTNGSPVNVFVGHQVGIHDDRTWYDGVGYVDIPEPTAYASVIGLSCLLLLCKRKRRT